MANSEAHFAQGALVISPNVLFTQELAPLLKAQLGRVPLNVVNEYFSPEKLPENTRAGQIVLLDMTSNREASLDLLLQTNNLTQPVRIVALLAENDPDLILRCMRAGATEFLVHPFTEDQVEAAFERLARLQSATEATATTQAKVFAVMPAKGSCGATTIASNLALQWKRSTNARVLLADLDPLTGNLSFLLKIKSTYSFLDTLHRAHELDHDLWKAMVTQVNGVDVLLAPELMPEGIDNLSDPSPILEYARHNYDVVILDANGVYGDWNLNVARAATEVLLITTNELPALQAAQRALSYLDTHRIGRWKLRLIVNRYLLDVGLSREVIGTALHTEVFDTLPSDYEAVQKALMEGKPITSASGFGKAVQQMVGKLGGKIDGTQIQESPKKSGLFSGLFSKSVKSK